MFQHYFMNCKYLDIVIYCTVSSKTAPSIQSHITRNYENKKQSLPLLTNDTYVYDISISSKVYKINELCYKKTTVNVVSKMHLCGYIFIANVLLEANRILIYAWMADCYIRNTASCICQQYPTSTLFLPLMFKQQSCT